MFTRLRKIAVMLALATVLAVSVLGVTAFTGHTPAAHAAGGSAQFGVRCPGLSQMVVSGVEAASNQPQSVTEYFVSNEAVTWGHYWTGQVDVSLYTPDGQVALSFSNSVEPNGWISWTDCGIPGGYGDGGPAQYGISCFGMAHMLVSGLDENNQKATAWADFVSNQAVTWGHYWSGWVYVQFFDSSWNLAGSYWHYVQQNSWLSWDACEP